MTVEDRRGHRGRPANAELVLDLSVPGGAVAVLEEVTDSIAGLR